MQEHTKTSAGMRCVPLLDTLSGENVQENKKAVKNENFYIFGGEKPLTNRAFRSRWEKYSKDTNTSFTPHQFRHGYASIILYEADVDEQHAKNYMGHSKISVTRNIYTHIRNSKENQEFNKMNTKLNTIVDKNLKKSYK